MKRELKEMVNEELGQQVSGYTACPNEEGTESY